MAKTTSPQSRIMLWQTLVGASLMGLVASFVQTVERIQFADNPAGQLYCDINATFSCSNVFTAWQSSVFGFSNSIMCLAFFAVLLGAALAGLTGAKLSKSFRFSLHGASLFFLGFGAWYLWQSVYVIGALCIFCLFCYAAVILLNLAWLRINANDLPLSRANKQHLGRILERKHDFTFWALYAASFVVAMALHFS